MINKTARKLLLVASVALLFASCNRDLAGRTAAPVAANQEATVSESPFNLRDTTYYTPVESFDDSGASGSQVKTVRIEFAAARQLMGCRYPNLKSL